MRRIEDTTSEPPIVSHDPESLFLTAHFDAEVDDVVRWITIVNNCIGDQTTITLDRSDKEHGSVPWERT